MLRSAFHHVSLIAIVYDGMLTLAIHRFSSAVVMEVTYGYNVKGKDTFLTSMQRAGDIVLRVSTPEIMAICTAFPFGGLLPSNSHPHFLYVCIYSEGITCLVSGNGVQGRRCRMPALGI